MKETLIAMFNVMLFIHNVYAQNIDSTYYSIQEAKVNPLNVKVLILSEQNLRKIPKEVFTFKNLTSLNLTYNKLRRIPDEIEELKNLEDINLSYNRIKRVSKNITKLKQLKILIIRYNNLEQLPSSFIELRTLQVLNIDGNKIKDLKMPLSFLLTDLSARHNQITTLKDGFFGNLQRVDLTSNKINYLPEDLQMGINLTSFNLNNNLLEEVEEDLFMLPKLEELKLGKNRLRTLPELEEKSNIKVLDISENFISKSQIKAFKKISNIPVIISLRKLNGCEYDE